MGIEPQFQKILPTQTWDWSTELLSGTIKEEEVYGLCWTQVCRDGRVYNTHNIMTIRWRRNELLEAWGLYQMYLLPDVHPATGGKTVHKGDVLCCMWYVCLILLCNAYMRTRHHCYMVGNIDITTLYAFHLLNDLFLDAPKSLVGMVLGVVYLHTNASLAMPVIRTLLSVGA